MKEANKEENIYRNLYSFIPSLTKPLYEKDEKNLKDVVDTFVARLKKYNKNGEYDQKIKEILSEFEKWREDPVLYNRKHNIAGTFDKENEEAFAMVNNRSIKSRDHDEVMNEKQKQKKINKAKFNRKKLKKIGRIVLAVMGAGVIMIGAKQATKNLETIEVPVPDDNSISDINETYDTSWYNLPANEWFSDKNKIYKDDTIELTVSNKKVDDIKNKANEVRKEIEEKSKSYTFKYKVEYGDTVYALEERFDCKLNITGILREGVTLNITTNDKELANEMQALYDKKMKEEEPVSFEYYIVKNGDTLPEIANNYGVSCDDIMKYNSSIKSINKIDEGQTIKIPVYENEKTNGMAK